MRDLSRAKSHEFYKFMDSIRKKLGDDYSRIKARAKEDPGTAGDEGEESWAEVLREWLPATYPVVTKGRLLFENGEASPQVDVLVLRPSYPAALRNKKYYFSGGVVAAFECKLRLRRSDIKKAVKTSAALKRKSEFTTHTVFDDLFRLPFFGILAHSSEWKRDPIFRLHDALQTDIPASKSHPREAIDIACIADSGITSAFKDILIRKHSTPEELAELREMGFDAAVLTVYSTQSHSMARSHKGRVNSDALATLIQSITTILAYDDPSLRPWVEHLSRLGFTGGIGKGLFSNAREVLYAETLRRIEHTGFDEDRWSRWQKHVP